nr:PREDICTED: laminin subunit alpha-4 [Latimeria chalumnae]|eukprot:XP_014340991.1 PREDICTED: laminin subunit alpha-4 [Latimeria chalumnae]
MALISFRPCLFYTLFFSGFFCPAISRRGRSGFPLAIEDGLNNPSVSSSAVFGGQYPVVPAAWTPSTEECSPGFFLSDSGQCLLCSCNGHSASCLPRSGVCINCRHNTAGDHCERCLEGFIALVWSTSCEPCPCPLSTNSNNFAVSCANRGGTVRCVCQDNYAGPSCERCAPGYYGNPLLIGNSCQKCNCNGNSDPNLIFDDCDEVSGHCRNCLRNTTGVNCERCATGYYGDAIVAKNCTECICEKCGTASCDELSGECHCRPGVTGPLCDRCKVGYHGYDSCLGCQRCECGLASVDDVCDPVTQQCKCRFGAIGLYCEQCQYSFWNYGPHGCQRCDCGGGPCNSRTGECLPEDTEPPATTDCTVVSKEGENISHLLTNGKETQIPEWINSSVYRKFQVVEVETKITTLQSDLDTLEKQESSTLTKGRNVERKTLETVRHAEQIVKQASSLNTSIQEIITQLKFYGMAHELSQHDIAKRLIKAEKMLREMKQKNFTSQKQLAEKESGKADKLLDHVGQFEFWHNGTRSLIPSLLSQLSEYSTNLSDVKELLQEANKNIKEAEDKNKDIAVRFREHENAKSELEEQHEAASEIIKMAEVMLVDTELAVAEMDNMIQNVSEFHAAIDGSIKLLRERLTNLSTYDKDLVLRAFDFAKELQSLAAKMESHLKKIDTNGFVQKAINASNVYENIATYIEEANKTALFTLSAANRTKDAITGISTQLGFLKDKSERLLNQAKASQESAEARKALTVEDTRNRLKGVINKKDELKGGLSKAIGQLQLLQQGNTREQSERASLIAEEANSTSALVTQTVAPINKYVNEWAQNLEDSKDDISDYSKAVKAAGDTVNNLTEIVPQLLDKLRIIEQKQPHASNLSVNILRIRELIAQTRSVASKVQVAMKFDGQSSVEVRPKINLEDLKASSSLSLYMKPSPANQPVQTSTQDRCVLYLGSKNAQRDYMGLAIKNDNLVYIYNLGSGDVEIPLSSKPISTWPAYFTLVKIERVGKYGKVFLTVPNPSSTAEEKFVKTGKAPGVDSLLDLDPDNTVFYVGGVPSDFRLPVSLNLPNYVGDIELATLNDNIISLYNFKQLHNMDTAATPPSARYKLAFTQSRAANYFFDGSGYALVSNIERRGKFSQVTRFDVEVRTPADNALLLLMVNGSMYFSLQMQDGYLIVHYDFGFAKGPVVLEDNLKKAQINDAKYHEISVIYHNSKKMILVVDRRHVKSVESEKKAMPFTDIYIGGVPSELLTPSLRSNLAVDVGFRGCIKGFQFQKKDFNLLEEPGSLGISSGCPEESLMSRTAYFNGESFIASSQKIFPFENFEGGFNFRTLQPSGLLFHYDEGADVFSVALDNGSVVFNMKGTTLKSGGKEYSDGQNHFIVTSVTPESCQLVVDDKDKQHKDLPTSGKREQNPATNNKFYFGGSPSSQYSNFTGCISNAYLTKVDRDVEVEDFQRYTEKVQVSLHDCPVEKPPAALVSKHERNSVKSKEGRKRKAGRAKGNIPQLPVGLKHVYEGSNPKELSQCYLSLRPTATQHAYQYGGTPNSRQEFNSIPESFSERSHFSISLRTRSSHSLIFYVADEWEDNFMALFLAHGRIVYMFNVGHQKLRIKTQEKYNDGLWHNAIFMREKNKGRLIVDGIKVLEQSLDVNDAPWHVRKPFYVGGVPPRKAVKNIQLNSVQSFSGCLRNFQLDGQWISSASQAFGVTPCFEGAMELGTYFSAEGGYLVLDDSFNLGLKFELVFEVRSRNSSGILLHVRSPNSEYINLHMKHGQVVVEVYNGMHEFATTVTPKQSICDGKWHRIAVIRDSNVVQLDVDSEVNHVVGPLSPRAIHDKEPVFIGGVPESLLSSRLEIRNSFTGCIRNFIIDESPVSFSKAALVSGAVSINSCPAA